MDSFYSILIPVVFITLLLLLNALFVAAEFAIIGIPKVLVEKLAGKGKKTALRLRDVLNNSRLQDLYITTAQLGITLASLGLGMYGEHVLAEWLYQGMQLLHLDSKIAAHSVATVISIIILTYLHIVVGEMIPKSLALKYAEPTALFVTPLMAWIQFILYPFIFVLNKIGNTLLKLFGVDRADAQLDSFYSSQEIQYIVKESSESGLIEPESANVLNEILEFGELTARDVIVHRVKIVAIPIDASYEDLVEITYTNSHSRYPVYTGDLDHIIGMIHIKDILNLLQKKSSLKKEHIRNVLYFPENISVDKIFAAMRKNHTQMIIVSDEYGGTEGLITIDDIFEQVIGSAA